MQVTYSFVVFSGGEQDGLLVVSPGFSHVIAEESQVLHYDTEVRNLEAQPATSRPAGREGPHCHRDTPAFPLNPPTMLSCCCDAYVNAARS